MHKINDYCLLEKETTRLKWNSYTREKYEEKGYTFTKIGEEFEIKIVDILKGSNKKVGMICPVCGKKYTAQVRKLYRTSSLNMNTICSQGCHKKIKHKNDKCYSCGVENTIFRHINNEKYCNKCYRKMSRKGEFYKGINELNDIHYYFDYAEIILRDNLGEINGRAKIDLDDIEKIKDIKWRLGANGYVYGTGGKYNSIKLHRVIMNTPKHLEVDHIFHNPLDNRKKYLRNVENCNNRKTRNQIIRMSGIKKYAIEDGVGIRMSLYSCFCPHHCKGCHNPMTWDYDNGYDETIENLFQLIKENENIDGVTFSGGEPFEQWKQFYELSKLIKTETKLNIWCYTGYTYEQLIKDDEKRLLLEMCDVVIDGRFVESKKDLTLSYRGSSNQRVINVKETIKKGEVVLWEC